MNDAKHRGLDVHQATSSAAVLDSTGKLVMECILETKAAIVATHPMIQRAGPESLTVTQDRNKVNSKKIR